ncbi:MAG: radical SAM protein [bacterium]|nr:radical SAM protein [bacterium]
MKNIIKIFNREKKFLAKDATIAVTYKCNSRCRMCNIWQIANPSDLPLEYFYNLSPNLKYINLTGGEPFLRPDLPEIIKIIKTVSPKAKIIISSNGLAADLIVKQIKTIMKIDQNIGLRISLDGLGAVHDQVRGLNGFYSQVLATVSALKNLGVKNLGFSFTIMDFNADQIPAVYDLSKKLNLELALALVQNSEVYFKKNDNAIAKIDLAADGLNYVITQELKSFKVKRWFRAYYDYGLWYYLKFKKRLLKSGAGLDSLFIDPLGDIYPSNLIKLPFGNLREAPLHKIWHSREAKQMRQEIVEKNITESWIICTVRGEMKRHWLKIVWWIMRNKFF